MTAPADWPTGKYGAILADPPWPFATWSHIGLAGDSGQTNRGQRSRAAPYQTMSHEDIYSLPIGELTEKDCTLFLWVVQTQLPEAMILVERWGYDGWNVLDDNLLACPRPHVEAVFAMLRRQGRRIEFTGGLEALALEDYQIELLASLKPRPNMFFAYDPGDAFETLESAARRLLAAGFTARSHRLRCYVLIGFPKDTFDLAERRLRQMLGIGFTPMAMLWKPETPSQAKYTPAPAWRAFQRRWARPAIIHAKAAA